MLRLYTYVVFAFVSCSISASCCDTSDDDYHECTRSCSHELSSRKTCVYNFIVAESHTTTSFCNGLKKKDNTSTCINGTIRKSTLAINGKSPGPAIQVCLGDTIEIFVHNKLGNDELALHWHGIRLNGSNYMDGVPMITQCPILPFSGFRYKIHPENAGTYFYHAHSGERLDGILVAEWTVGKYAFDIQGLRDCQHLRHEAYILYEDAPVDSYTIRNAADSLDEQAVFMIAETGHHCNRISKNVICSLDLKDAKLQLEEPKADETIYVPFDTNAFSSFTDEMTDNSYNFYLSKYYPAYLSLEKGGTKIPQINGVSFKYPSSPILSQSEDTMENMICNLGERSNECVDTPLFCECLQLIQVPSRKTIEVVLIDEGFGGNVSYTFHLHGYTAKILGQESFKRPITKDEIMSLDRNDSIPRDLLRPVRKDTFVVPNKGYIILRFYTDNLGYWLWEARNTAIYPQLFGPGMQLLMRVGLHRNLPPVPIDFPSCGSNKGLDLIFETS